MLLLSGGLSGANLAVQAASFPRGPFVQNATTNSVQVIWRTPTPASTFVEFGLSTDLGSLVTDDALVSTHVATLSGLTPGTRYYYRAGSANAGGTTLGDVEWFQTLKTDGAVEIVVVGDSASGSADSSMVAAMMARERSRAEIGLHLGDVVYEGIGIDANVQTEFFNLYQPLIKNLPFYLIAGNHDLDASARNSRDDLTGTNFQALFYLPTNTATGTELFYSFDHGDVHFTCLFVPWFLNNLYSQISNGSPQYIWMTNDLATSAKPWKLLLTHFPVANAGTHANRDYYTNSIPDQVDLLSLLLPPAQQYGVQMILASHDHNYQKFAPTNGVHILVSGGGGRALYQQATQHVALAQFWPIYHYCNLSVGGDTLRIQAVNTNGTVFDSLTVTKALPPRLTHQASWHTPAIASGPANDGDGNIMGQVFDFIGPPMLPRAGRFSNLGQVFVNNDATNLYVGLAQVMMYPNGNVFLFIESPRQPGVTELAGVGNGVIDPAGQGADGLDCLENLAFTGFAPSVGCILGDEFADGNARSFTRTNLALNIGQGVYYLDAGLGTVPGTRLQQFNRSPQSGVGTNEANADFMEVAIPFSALGGLHPGDTIKLGAVVGGGQANPAAKTRELDTAALGCSLDGSGTNRVVLEGLSVRLAIDPASPLVAIVPVASHQFRLSWSAQVGRQYDIEYAEMLSDFAPLGAPGFPRTATSTNESFVVTAPASGAGFYRIRLLP